MWDKLLYVFVGWVLACLVALLMAIAAGISGDSMCIKVRQVLVASDRTPAWDMLVAQEVCSK